MLNFRCFLGEIFEKSPVTGDFLRNKVLKIFCERDILRKLLCSKGLVTRDANTWSNFYSTLIGLSMQPSQYTYIRDAKNGVDAWTALKDAYEKNSRSTRINLKRQFYNFEHDINAPIQVYISGITDLAGKLKAIGVALTDEDITDVLIFNLDNEYSSIASTLMASKSEFKVADVTSALLEEEQRKGGAPPPSVDTIALMGKSSDHPHFGTGPPGRRGPYRDARDGIKRTCYRCGRTGHTFKFCRAGRDINGKPIPDDKESKEDEKSSLAYLATIDESLNHWSY